MAGFIQQNWVGIIFVAAMLAMHLGGHRRGGHSGRGVRGGCGAGHARQGTHLGGDQAHGEPHQLRRPEEGAEAPTALVSDVGHPDPTRDAVNPDADEPVRPDRGQRFLRPPDRQPR